MSTISVTTQFVDGSDVVSRTRQFTGSSITKVDEAIADSETDKAVGFTLDVSACLAFMIVSDQDVTIETNDGSSPDDTLTLAADEPYDWNEDSEHAFLLGTDVTVLYVTNASGSTANVKIRALVDATP